MNPQKENTMPEETPIKENSKNGRRAKKAESSEESAEEQDDVMDLDEEEEMALRFRRNSCMHGARRKSLDGLCSNDKLFKSFLRRFAPWTVVAEIISCWERISQQRR